MYGTKLFLRFNQRHNIWTNSNDLRLIQRRLANPKRAAREKPELGNAIYRLGLMIAAYKKFAKLTDDAIRHARNAGKSPEKIAKLFEQRHESISNAQKMERLQAAYQERLLK